MSRKLERDGKDWRSKPEWKAQDKRHKQYMKSIGIRIIRITEKMAATIKALRKAGIACE